MRAIYFGDVDIEINDITIGGLICGFGLYLLFVVIFRIYSSLRIRNHGILATATITHKYKNMIHYIFMDAEDNKIKGCDSVETYKQMMQYQSGKKISIKYDPSNPKNNQLFDIKYCEELEDNTSLKQEKDTIMMFILGTINAIIFGPICNVIIRLNDMMDAFVITIRMMVIGCILSLPFCLVYASSRTTRKHWFRSKDEYKLAQKRVMSYSYHDGLPYNKNDSNYKPLY